MTGRWRDLQQERHDDERCVDALLAESGFPGDSGLRQVLLELRRFRNCEVPAPSAELAVLLGQSQACDVVPLAAKSGRRPGRGRIAFTSLAVAASLGVAGGAAAGNDAVRRGAEATISTLVRALTPPSPAPPPPQEPATAPAEPAAVVPSPRVVAPPVPVPAGPPQLPAEEPGRRMPADPAPGNSTAGSSPVGGASNAATGLPSAVPRDAGKPAAPPASRPAARVPAELPRTRDTDTGGKGDGGADRHPKAEQPAPAVPSPRR